jgi:tetratricopeptide (TPR) repeat protein
MYLGRYHEALAALQPGVEADLKGNNSGELAVKYVAKAEAHLALGQRAQAIEASGKALQTSPADSVQYLAARVLLMAGEDVKARKVAADLENKLQNETKSVARLILGEIALQRNRMNEAVEAFQEAQKLQDSWISRFLLGRAYAQAGHFAEALSELDTCRKRKGEAADLFFEDMTTLRYLPPLYYWQGRAQEGLGSKEGARKSYQEFLALRAEANPGAPLVEDAKRRSSSQ